jgi:hypothetical protein
MHMLVVCIALTMFDWLEMQDVCGASTRKYRNTLLGKRTCDN